MSQISQTDKKQCENCGEQIFGRADKRFCDTYCKNTFNSKRRKAEAIQLHENTDEILNIIKRNYQILKSYQKVKLVDGERIYFNKEDLEKDGLNQNFFTSIWIENDQIRKFCFERGWTISGDLCLVTDRDEQVRIL